MRWFFWGRGRLCQGLGVGFKFGWLEFLTMRLAPLDQWHECIFLNYWQNLLVCQEVIYRCFCDGVSNPVLKSSSRTSAAGPVSAAMLKQWTIICNFVWWRQRSLGFMRIAWKPIRNAGIKWGGEPVLPFRMFGGLSPRPHSMMILIRFAPNPANPRKILW